MKPTDKLDPQLETALKIAVVDTSVTGEDLERVRKYREAYTILNS